MPAVEASTNPAAVERSPDMKRAGSIEAVQKAFGSFVDIFTKRKSEESAAGTCQLVKHEEKRRHVLLEAMLQSDIATIRNYSGDWNFTGTIPARPTPVTPLSVLCRPQLCDALKKVSRDEQLNLVASALKNGANPWQTMDKDPNARAITDTVYQGDVELLKLMLNFRGEFPVTQEKLLAYRLYGTSLLHMACYDSRSGMIQFLVNEMGFDPCIQASNGTPLFWVFARGPVRVECARFLISRGADPFKRETLSRKLTDKETKAGMKEKQPCEMSPLSMAIGAYPEFAKEVLQAQYQHVSSRGTAKTIRFDWKEFLVSKDQDNVVCIPKMAVQIPPTTNAWETLNWDTDPSHQLTYMEMILENERKELVVLPIVKEATKYMWKNYAGRAFFFQISSFILFWVLVIVGTCLWPRRISQHEFNENGLKAPAVCSVTLGLTFFPIVYLMWVELQEGRHSGSFRTYLTDFWNWADMFLYASGVFLFVATLGASTAKSYTVYLNCDRVICTLAVCSHLMLSLKGVQFAQVPKKTATMVSMLAKMMVDVTKFGCIWMILFIGYGNALWGLWKNSMIPKDEALDVTLCLSAFSTAANVTETVECTPQWEWHNCYAKLFYWTLGDGVGEFVSFLDPIQFNEGKFFASVLHYSWIIIVAIMLLNMLIAMMGNTYSNVADNQIAETEMQNVKRIHNLWLVAPQYIKEEFLRHLWDKSGQNVDIDESLVQDEEEAPITAVQNKLDKLEARISELQEKLDEKLDNILEGLLKNARPEAQPKVASKDYPPTVDSSPSGVKRSSVLMAEQRTRMASIQEQKGLRVKVVRGKNLQKMDQFSASDPYIYVETKDADGNVLSQDRSQLVKNNNLDPVFDWKSNDILKPGAATVEISVWDQDNPTMFSAENDELMGTMSFTIEQIKQENNMISGWFPLKPADKAGELDIIITLQE